MLKRILQKLFLSTWDVDLSACKNARKWLTQLGFGCCCFYAAFSKIQFLTLLTFTKKHICKATNKRRKH